MKTKHFTSVVPPSTEKTIRLPLPAIEVRERSPFKKYRRNVVEIETTQMNAVMRLWAKREERFVASSSRPPVCTATCKGLLAEACWNSTARNYRCSMGPPRLMLLNDGIAHAKRNHMEKRRTMDQEIGLTAEMFGLREPT
jgi:hypothetical protein